MIPSSCTVSDRVLRLVHDVDGQVQGWSVVASHRLRGEAQALLDDSPWLTKEETDWLVGVIVWMDEWIDYGSFGRLFD